MGDRIRLNRTIGVKPVPVLSRRREYCKRGHRLKDTRKWHKNGESYCGECHTKGVDKYSKAHKEQRKYTAWKCWLKRVYGLTPEQVEGKPCEICGTTDFLVKRKTTGDIKHPSVDHDHDTGKFRGILCSRCNMGIGLLGPNLAKALDYMNRHRP